MFSSGEIAEIYASRWLKPFVVFCACFSISNEASADCPVSGPIRQLEMTVPSEGKGAKSSFTLQAGGQALALIQDAPGAPVVIEVQRPVAFKATRPHMDVFLRRATIAGNGMLSLPAGTRIRTIRAEGTDVIGSLTTRWKADSYRYDQPRDLRGDFIEEIRVPCKSLATGHTRAGRVPRYFDPYRPGTTDGMYLPEKWETYGRSFARLRKEPRWDAPSITLRSNRDAIGFRFAELETRGKWLKVQYYADPQEWKFTAIGWILRSSVFELDFSVHPSEERGHPIPNLGGHSTFKPPPGTVIYEGKARISRGTPLFRGEVPFAFVAEELSFDVKFLGSSERVSLMGIPGWRQADLWSYTGIAWVPRNSLLTWPPSRVVPNPPPTPPKD